MFTFSPLRCTLYFQRLFLVFNLKLCICSKAFFFFVFDILLLPDKEPLSYSRNAQTTAGWNSWQFFRLWLIVKDPFQPQYPGCLSLVFSFRPRAWHERNLQEIADENGGNERRYKRGDRCLRNGDCTTINIRKYIRFASRTMRAK